MIFFFVFEGDAQIITADVILGVYIKKSLKPENASRTDKESNKGMAQKQLVMRQMDDSSNFSFDEFLKETMEWHNKTENELKTKTIKFNFNSTEATQNAVDILVRKGSEVCMYKYKLRCFLFGSKLNLINANLNIFV